jgi:small subunit ribosomal protein S10
VADVAKQMDAQIEQFKGIIEPKWKMLGESKSMGTVEKIEELLTSERFKAAGGR